MGGVSKWLLKPLGLLVVLGFFLFPSGLQAQEIISSFVSQISIQEDSTVLVKENITYDFGNRDRHGIFRTVPTRYQTDTGRRSIAIELMSVKRDGDSESYSLTQGGGEVEIKIGDSERTITGPHTYVIEYEVRGALNYFESFDELYWNVTGDEWPAVIERAKTEITLPQQVSPRNIRVACYQGKPGSGEDCKDLLVTEERIIAQSLDLSPGEGMTIAVGFPKGVVREPTRSEKLGAWLSDNYIIFLPLLVLVAMYFIWRRWGKEPRKQRAIYARYQPPEDMHPALVGSVIDGSVDSRDITAAVVYAAEQGHLVIRHIENKGIFGKDDYELILREDLEKIEDPIITDILEMIFGSHETSQQVNALYLVTQLFTSQDTESQEWGKAGYAVRLNEIAKQSATATRVRQLRKDIKQSMIDREYYEKGSLARRAAMIGFGFFGIFWGAIWFFGTFGLSGLIAGVLSGAIFLGFAFFMDKRTLKGMEAYEHILGFKQFLAMTQKERLEFHNAPQKSPQEFMEYLPYAIALGVDEEWAEQFSDLSISSPDWYQGSGMSGAVAANTFADNFSGFTDSFNSGFSQAASGGSGSGGGGMSGGGMGGGGGGSW